MNFKEIAKSGDFIASVCLIIFIVMAVIFIPRIPIKYTDVKAQPIENMMENNSYQINLVSLP